ncbi:glyoxalase [Polaribacter sp. HL-MS24]|uniref:glyoxalase n=1 Tax=Polaribacter sp. HL-MS24 TaxID=3077735 RepID=UPI00293451B8|nr:glyoxalase [Polaribacter sp. HL-MS24]WOC40447.1 glyoxalase [Polaribacter sp. HL-MS24]
MDARKDLRPVLPTIEETDKCSVEEKFQNETLRQIIKLQHYLLIALFKTYAFTRKTDLQTTSEQRIKRFIESALSKDLAFKNRLIGVIIGQFTMEELEIYKENSSEFNKRILAILKKRLKDSLSELVPKASIL